jgi:cell division protein DivIC
MRILSNKVHRFRAIEPVAQQTPTPNLPTKIHSTVRRRRIIWFLLIVAFIVWCAVQLVIQEMRVWDKEALLHKRQQELASTQMTTKQLEKQIERFDDSDYLMEQAHKHGYGKPGEKNVQISNK